MSDITVNPIVALTRNIGAPMVYYFADGRALFGCLGSPQNVIAANGGSIAIDVTNKVIYLKTTDTVNTGWLAIGTLSATGVANTIAIFTSANALGNSILTQPGGSTTEVDVNSTNQVATLKLVGTDRNGSIANTASGTGVKTERLDICRDGSGNGNAALEFRNSANNAQHGDIGLDSANNIIIQPTTTGLAVIRNGAAGANLIIGATNTIGASAVSVLELLTGTPPGNFPADAIQIYSKDATAGNNQLIAVNENGQTARITGRIARTTSQFDKTSSTALADIPGLTWELDAGQGYMFDVEIPTTSNVAGGVQFSLHYTGTISGLLAEALVTNGAAIAVVTVSRVSALDTAFGNITAVTTATARIRGSIFTSTSGTFTIRFAQNASNATPSSVLVGASGRIEQN